ncbi:hypothetical protein SLS60_009555 [Paraconiothyrium brasiliense]|uniref:2EXR domain-containing protein n=1 Tax=Paraconiothyrium brasiliense TaxID=300254 RepID=A0ABR3QUP7_9PLEO
MVSFLTLPGEIRNQIYDLALFPRYCNVSISVSHPKDLLRTVFKSPIFRLCRTSRYEAFARFCKMKTLTFMTYKSYKVFVTYASTVGEGDIAEKNVKSIALMVKHLLMLDIDERVGGAREVMEKWDFLDADKAFMALGALQVVRLFVQDQPGTGLQFVIGNEVNTTLTRDNTVDGVRFSEISAYTGLPRVAIFSTRKHS